MTRSVLVVALLALALVGCSPTPSATTPAPTAAPSAPAAASPSPSFSPNTNARSNISKRLGEQAGGLCRVGATQLSQCDMVFTIERVSGCQGGGYEGEPVDGVRRIVWFKITTAEGYGSTQFGGDHPPGTVSSNDLQVIDGGGVTRPAGVSTYWECVPQTKRLPTTFQPSSTYQGGVEIVVPKNARTLVFAPSWSPLGGWEFPTA